MSVKMNQSNTKKVLYVCGGRSFSGAQVPRKLAEVAKTWEGQGYEVMHVCGGDIEGGKNGAEIQVRGSCRPRRRVRENSIIPAFFKHSISEWRDIQHDAEVVKHLKKAIDEFKPDIVWERSCRLHNAGLIIARQLNVPYVLEWKDHLVDYNFSFFRRRALVMEEKKNREADHVVVESVVLREQLALEGVEEKKILVAHNAVDSNEFERDEKKGGALRAELGIDAQTVLVGYLGSYAFYHDSVRLVLAADCLRREHPDKSIRFLMVGSGLEFEETRAHAESLGLLDDTVIMLPRVDKEEVPDILSALDIAVLPGSTDIICPIKIQEYMASSLPAVVPDYLCNREVIEDGVTGSLFNPHDEASLARVIVKLAVDGRKRRAIGDRARLEAVNKFSWQATWGRALNEILEDYEAGEQLEL